jgi:RND superfamily putative drug exporter
LDTTVVRSLLVPAFAYDIGRRIWWPSQLDQKTPPDETAVPVQVGQAGNP